MSDEITPNNQTSSTNTADRQVEPQNEPISEPVQAPESQTAQIPVNEPLNISEEPKIDEPTIEEVKIEETEVSVEPKPIKEKIKPEIPESTQNQEKVEKTSEPKIETKEQKEEIKNESNSEIEKEVSETKPEPKQERIVPVIISTRSKARELLVKARNAIQFRKRKKLDRVLSLFAKQTKITNDEVEKFLHISDATTTRYLSQLEKEGKIKQTGKTGKAVSYIKI